MPAEKRPSRKAPPDLIPTPPKAAAEPPGKPAAIPAAKLPERPASTPDPEAILDGDDGAPGQEGEDETVMGENLGAPVAEERRARPRRKKKEMPEGLWLKCESCGAMIYRKELEDKGMVCPSCDFHFTLGGKARIAMLVDPGTWEEKYAELTALDRLDFTDSVPYSEKIARTVKRTGQNEALLLGL